MGTILLVLWALSMLHTSAADGGVHGILEAVAELSSLTTIAQATVLPAFGKELIVSGSLMFERKGEHWMRLSFYESVQSWNFFHYLKRKKREVEMAAAMKEFREAFKPNRRSLAKPLIVGTTIVAAVCYYFFSNHEPMEGDMVKLASAAGIFGTVNSEEEKTQLMADGFWLHSKGDHKLLLLEGSTAHHHMAAMLGDDPRGRSRESLDHGGFTYQKNGKDIYQVVDGCSMHTLTGWQFDGDLIDVWVCRNKNTIKRQRDAILNGEGGGSNFGNMIWSPEGIEEILSHAGKSNHVSVVTPSYHKAEDDQKAAVLEDLQRRCRHIRTADKDWSETQTFFSVGRKLKGNLCLLTILAEKIGIGGCPVTEVLGTKDAMEVATGKRGHCQIEFSHSSVGDDGKFKEWHFSVTHWVADDSMSEDKEGRLVIHRLKDNEAYARICTHYGIECLTGVYKEDKAVHAKFDKRFKALISGVDGVVVGNHVYRNNGAVYSIAGLDVKIVANERFIVDGVDYGTFDFMADGIVAVDEECGFSTAAGWKFGDVVMKCRGWLSSICGGEQFKGAWRVMKNVRKLFGADIVVMSNTKAEVKLGNGTLAMVWGYNNKGGKSARFCIMTKMLLQGSGGYKGSDAEHYINEMRETVERDVMSIVGAGLPESFEDMLNMPEQFENNLDFVMSLHELAQFKDSMLDDGYRTYFGDAARQSIFEGLFSAWNPFTVGKVYRGPVKDSYEQVGKSQIPGSNLFRFAGRCYLPNDDFACPEKGDAKIVKEGRNWNLVFHPADWRMHKANESEFKRVNNRTVFNASEGPDADDTWIVLTYVDKKGGYYCVCVRQPFMPGSGWSGKLDMPADSKFAKAAKPKAMMNRALKIIKMFSLVTKKDAVKILAKYGPINSVEVKKPNAKGGSRFCHGAVKAGSSNYQTRGSLWRKSRRNLNVGTLTDEMVVKYESLIGELLCNTLDETPDHYFDDVTSKYGMSEVAMDFIKVAKFFTEDVIDADYGLAEDPEVLAAMDGLFDSLIRDKETPIPYGAMYRKDFLWSEDLSCTYPIFGRDEEGRRRCWVTYDPSTRSLSREPMKGYNENATPVWSDALKSKIIKIFRNPKLSIKQHKDYPELILTRRGVAKLLETLGYKVTESWSTDMFNDLEAVYEDVVNFSKLREIEVQYKWFTLLSDKFDLSFSSAEESSRDAKVVEDLAVSLWEDKFNPGIRQMVLEASAAWASAPIAEKTEAALRVFRGVLEAKVPNYKDSEKKARAVAKLEQVQDEFVKCAVMACLLDIKAKTAWDKNKRRAVTVKDENDLFVSKCNVYWNNQGRRLWPLGSTIADKFVEITPEYDLQTLKYEDLIAAAELCRSERPDDFTVIGSNLDKRFGSLLKTTLSILRNEYETTHYRDDGSEWKQSMSSLAFSGLSKFLAKGQGRNWDEADKPTEDWTVNGQPMHTYSSRALVQLCRDFQ